MLKASGTAIIMIVLLTVVTGVVYPLVVTGIAQLVFPGRANGSMLEKDGKVVGSELIGQPFTDAKYFWSRPSATSPIPYNAGASTGSNLGPLNPALLDGVKKRIETLRSTDSSGDARIPVDLVTMSGSGLDPHISVAAAHFQIGRVARNRGMADGAVRLLVDQNTEGRQLGFLGEPRVNVLKLNLALDSQQSSREVK